MTCVNLYGKTEQRRMKFWRRSLPNLICLFTASVAWTITSSMMLMDLLSIVQLRLVQKHALYRLVIFRNYNFSHYPISFCNRVHRSSLKILNTNQIMCIPFCARYSLFAIREKIYCWKLYSPWNTQTHTTPNKFARIIQPSYSDIVIEFISYFFFSYFTISITDSPIHFWHQQTATLLYLQYLPRPKKISNLK